MLLVEEISVTTEVEGWNTTTQFKNDKFINPEPLSKNILNHISYSEAHTTN